MITVNGVLLSTHGFTAEPGRRVPTLGGEDTQVVDIPGALGVVRTAGIVRPQTLRVSGVLKQSTHALVLGKLDTLAGLLRGECVIRLDDYTEREWVGYLQRPPEPYWLGPDWTATAARLDLSFVLPNPTARERTATVLGGSGLSGGAGGTYPLTIGTAPSGLRLEVAVGPSVPITAVGLSVLAGEDVLQEIEWSGSVPAEGSLIIDTAAMTVIDGAGANRIAGVSVSSVYPLIDPAESPTHAKVVIEGGGGHALAVSYRRRWW